MAFYLMNVSVITCKLRLFAWMWIETFYSWMMVKVLFGAIIAIWCPFYFQTFKHKTAYKLLPLFLLVMSFLTATPVFFVTTLIKLTKSKLVCSPIAGMNVILDKLYAFVSSLNMVFYPQIFQIILTVILGIGLKKLANQRKNLFTSQRRKQMEKQENAMKKSAIMVFVILIANLACGLPTTIVWISSFVLEMLPNPPMELSNVLVWLAQIFLALLVLPHSWNLFIYLWKIPKCFREVVARLHLQ